MLYQLPAVRDGGMPLLGVASLLAGNVNWDGAQTFWLALCAALCLLGYGLGCLLAGRAAGVASAAALFAGQSYSYHYFDVEPRFYCLFLTLVAASLSLTWFSPRARRLAESCAIGLSFLARSVLCWFPLILAALELARAKRGNWRPALKSAAVYLVVPLLFLLPWIKFNYASGNGLVVFDSRGDWNVATGAFGVVSTFEGDYRHLVGIGIADNPTLWAIKRIVSHPVVYIVGVARRAGFAFSLYPATLTLWLISALLLWRRPAFRRINLMGLYFLAVHVAFSSEERYFVALMPLLAALTAASVFALADDSGGTARREGLLFSAAAALPLVLAGLFCMFLLLRHPGAVVDKKPFFDRALASGSGDAWLLRAYGKYQLLNGDYAGAYNSLGRAVTLSPVDASAKLELAVAAMFKNRRHNRNTGGADLIERLPLENKEWFLYLPGQDYVLKALYELNTGHRKEATRSIAAAKRKRSAFIHFKLRSDAVSGAGEAALRATDTELVNIYLGDILIYFPPELQKKLGTEFLSVYNGDAKEFRAAADAKPQPGGGVVFNPGFDAKRDAARDIKDALALARAGNKRVLLEVGGYWCVWCAAMDKFFADNPGVTAVRDRGFILVKVYANPSEFIPAAIKKYPKIAGYPHIYILDADGALLESKDTTQLELNSGYDREKFAAFLQHWEKR